ncbi:MAG: hypothetical protein HY541_02755 [Deltaproteobacteria bacterium]|nr:hypothetical protein [Deltaproteobacteria bacterium]
MKKQLITLTTLVAGFILIAGCGGGSGTGTTAGTAADTDGGPATTSFSVQLAAGSPSALTKALDTEEGEDESVETADASSGVIVLTSARIVLDRIDLKLPEGEDCDTLEFALEDGDCGASSDDDSEEEAEDEAEDLSSLLKQEDDDAEDEDDAEDDGEDEAEDDDDASEDEDHIRIEGPFVVDMMTGLATPSLTDVTVPSGNYREISLRLHDLDEDSTLVEAGDELLGNSLDVGGTYNDGTTERSFKIVLKFDEQIRYRSDAGFDVAESADVNEIVVSLNVADWFAGIDLGACLDSGNPDVAEDGTFVINEENDEGDCQFTDELKQTIKDSGSVDREDDDEDEDGDDDEEDEDEEGDDDEEDEEDEEEDD